MMARLGPPPGLHGEFQGSAQAFRDSLASEPVLVLAALITVYIVLGVLYESTIHPITILSTLPSAGVGALLALIVTGTQFTVIALIGIVLLIGIVKKNAIMMIDFALEAERDRGTDAAGVDLPGVLAPFPTDHDDDDWPRCSAACPSRSVSGTGSELRRPSRNFDCRRPDHLANSDFVHDTGCLSVHGAPRSLAPELRTEQAINSDDDATPHDGEHAPDTQRLDHDAAHAHRAD